MCARIVARLAERPVLVVASAVAGVTDAILKAARDALTGASDISPILRLHARLAKAVGCDYEQLEPILARLNLLLRCVEILHVLPAAVLDEMLSVGERLSVRLLAAALQKEGLQAEPLDAHRAGFLTDDNHTSAAPLPETLQLLRKNLRWDGRVRVLTGFIGCTREGRITTVGRNGSDLTAAVAAAALSAQELQIWGDTPGVLSADPHLLPEARPVRRLCYEEAAELARFGATVLHPQTIIPLIPKSIPIRVVSSTRPEDEGTLILPHTKTTGAVVASRRGLALLLFHSHRLGEVVGDVPPLFEAVERRGWRVAVVANSRSTVGLVTEARRPQKGLHFIVRNGLVTFPKDGERLSRLAREISEQFADRGHIQIRRNVALVCVVGRGISTHLASIQKTLKEQSIPVLFQALPGRDISILLVVPQEAEGRAVTAIHALLHG